MQIVLATSNPHKLAEVRSVFDAATRAIRWALLDDIEAQLGHAIPEPVEDQPTFEGNALLKARAYAAASGRWCLADDSGLEVDALGGEPGVRSARFSGLAGLRAVVDPANNRHLLAALADVPRDQRTARYVCVLALVPPPEAASTHRTPEPLMARGTLEGRILLPSEATDIAQPWAGRGTQGFGYDPLFVLTGDSEAGSDRGRTTAEISPSRKNELSHRGQASRHLLAALQAQGLV